MQAFSNKKNLDTRTFSVWTQKKHADTLIQWMQPFLFAVPRVDTKNTCQHLHRTAHLCARCGPARLGIFLFFYFLIFLFFSVLCFLLCFIFSFLFSFWCFFFCFICLFKNNFQKFSNWKMFNFDKNIKLKKYSHSKFEQTLKFWMNFEI
jgi:hypothetical protein